MSRDPEAIDAELRLLAVVRAAVEDLGGRPTMAPTDALLEERFEAQDFREA